MMYQKFWQFGLNLAYREFGKKKVTNDEKNGQRANR